MIAEILEWCVTPCSWAARRNGLLAAQIAIRHRARRCRDAWRSHLEASRAFIAQCVEECPERGSVVVLGSGHANDFDLAFLESRFERVVLVDAVHPVEMQIRARFSRGRFRLVVADISNPDGPIFELVAGAGLVVSACVLSQLSLFSTGRSVEPTVSRHLALLRRAWRWALVTDVAAREIGSKTWDWLIDPRPLPSPRAEWTWTIAPPGESGPVGEERLVRAVAGWIHD